MTDEPFDLEMLDMLREVWTKSFPKQAPAHSPWADLNPDFGTFPNYWEHSLSQEPFSNLGELPSEAQRPLG